MKHILVVLLCLALTACAAPQESVSDVQAPVSTPAAQPPVQEASPLPVSEATPVESQPPVVKVTIPQSLIDLLAKRKSVKSMQYDYTATDEAQQYAVFIRGTKVKIGAATAQTLSYDGNFFSHVYFDTAAQTVKAMCDAVNLCSQTTNKGPFIVPYAEYYRKTPLDWALALEQGLYTPLEKESAEVLIDNRYTVVYKFEEGEKRTRFYIDKFYGVPLKIETLAGEEGSAKRTYALYKNAAYNSLTDADVTAKV